MFTPIIPKGAAKPIAPYVHGTKAGDTIYVAGTLSLDTNGQVLHVGDIRAQTRYVIEQILAVVEAGGGNVNDIAYNMIFLTDVNNYAGMNEVYAEFFGANPPARYCVITPLVREEALVEIASIAHISS